MTTTVSSKGQIVLPASLRRKIALSAGEKLAVKVESEPDLDRIIIIRKRPRRPQMKIVIDPVTKFPMLKMPPGSPKLTSAMVKEMLADFP